MYQLKLVLCNNNELKNQMHDIRERVLFTSGQYDRNHPDDKNPNNPCFIYMLNYKAVGAVRLDLIENSIAVVRLVAILQEYQGQKIGTKMLNEIESYAKSRAVNKLVTNAAIDVIGFYKSIGYIDELWVDSGEGISRQTTPMTKELK